MTQLQETRRKMIRSGIDLTLEKMEVFLAECFCTWADRESVKDLNKHEINRLINYEFPLDFPRTLTRHINEIKALKKLVVIDGLTDEFLGEIEIINTALNVVYRGSKEKIKDRLNKFVEGFDNEAIENLNKLLLKGLRVDLDN